MEIALLIGNYVVAALIYLFVFLVYRGLIAEVRAGRAEAEQRATRAAVPRMTMAAPVSSPRPAVRPTPAPTPAPVAAPAPVIPETPAPAMPEPPVERSPQPFSQAREASAASVREILAEEPPAEEAASEPHLPAFLTHDAGGLAPSMPPTPEPPVLVPEPEPEPPARREPPLGVVATPAPTPTAVPRLTVVKSDCVELPVGREFPLLAAATLGRSEQNLVSIPDHFVSSSHAIIFLKEGRRVLRDRGSTNGTLVGGRRITDDHILRDGDLIALGNTTLRYSEP
ncbi:MAG TPA: FHA domain-containing protein [Armatimonadota bacterium]|jgi:hypothetical protein